VKFSVEDTLLFVAYAVVILAFVLALFG